MSASMLKIKSLDGTPLLFKAMTFEALKGVTGAEEGYPPFTIHSLLNSITLCFYTAQLNKVYIEFWKALEMFLEGFWQSNVFQLLLKLLNGQACLILVFNPV